MRILSEINQNLTEYNRLVKAPLAIDTIRATFHKNTCRKSGTKLHLLNEIARSHGYKWRKMNKNSEEYEQIRKKYHFARDLRLTSIYELENFNMLYANTNANDRHKAQLEIYGLKQYHKDQPPIELIDELLSVVNNVSSVDLCFDRSVRFNTEKLSSIYELQEYGNTIYINDTELYSLSKIYIYNKALKNELLKPLYRIEATAQIRDLNIRNRAINPLSKQERLSLQLNQAFDDFQKIINLAI